MRSNFESPMKLHNKRRTLEACGPVEFGPDDDDKVDVTVRVTIDQGGHRAIDKESGVGPHVGAGMEEEMFLSDTEKNPKPGSAMGHGELLPAGGGAALDTWDQPVQIAEDRTTAVVIN